LSSLSDKIFVILVLIISVCGMVLAFLSYGGYIRDYLIWGAVLAGILGSSSSSLLSALDRKARGWEFNCGLKFPYEKIERKDDKREMFSERMSTFFMYRPVFGIIAGLLIYSGMEAGIFGDSGVEDAAKVIFWSLLSGLFIKSLIEKLKGVFDNLIGKK